MEPDEDDGPAPYGSPSDKERIWLHPSELGSLLPALPAQSRGKGRRWTRRWRALAVPVFAGMVGAALTLAVLVLLGAVGRPPAERVIERVAALPTYDLGEPDAVAQLASSVAPAIVGLRATTPSGDRFGSGVVFRSDGHVLTNHHLVDGATSIELTDATGRSWSADHRGSDPEADLAVLSVDGGTMQPAVLGTAESLRVGQTAVVVGAPAGPQGTPSVTAGVIAGLGQVVEVGGQAFYDVISTDATIGPRASGGALVDRTGTVVGIATTTSTGGDGGLGLVIPIDLARRVAEKLIAEGRVSYPWIGVAGTDLDPWTAKEYGVTKGTLVRRVVEESPAARGGLKVQDIVTAVDDAPISSMNELMMLVRRHEPGERIDLTVVRSGVTRTVKVRLEPRP